MIAIDYDISMIALETTPAAVVIGLETIRNI